MATDNVVKKETGRILFSIAITLLLTFNSTTTFNNAITLRLIPSIKSFRYLSRLGILILRDNLGTLAIILRIIAMYDFLSAKIA